MNQNSNVTQEIPIVSYAQQRARLMDDFMSGLTPDAKRIVEGSFERLSNSDVASSAKGDGDPAPDFVLPNARGAQIRLSDLLVEGPVVLSFYRGGWCPFCNLEFRALSLALPAIRGFGATLVGISPETPDNSLSTVEKNKLEFEILSDAGNRVSKAYGLIMQVDEQMRPLYLDWGLDVPAHNGEDSWELPVPATYVIDRGGIIRAGFVSKDYTQRMEPLNIIAALRDLAD